MLDRSLAATAALLFLVSAKAGAQIELIQQTIFGMD